MKELREEERREKRIEKGRERAKRREKKEDRRYKKAAEVRIQREGAEKKKARRWEEERIEDSRDPDGGGAAGWVWEDGGSGGSGESWEGGQEEERPDEGWFDGGQEGWEVDDGLDDRVDPVEEAEAEEEVDLDDCEDLGAEVGRRTEEEGLVVAVGRRVVDVVGRTPGGGVARQKA